MDSLCVVKLRIIILRPWSMTINMILSLYDKTSHAETPRSLVPVRKIFIALAFLLVASPSSVLANKKIQLPCDRHFSAEPPAHTQKLSPVVRKWILNTSNENKRQEYGRILHGLGHVVTFTGIDLPEIEATPLEVVAHKASQFPEDDTSIIIVEDTSLEVEGADIGINIRWLATTLHQHIGKPAVWKVLLAYRQGRDVIVFQGEVRGTIVAANGPSFGFDAVFRPLGSSRTLAEDKPDHLSARAQAIRNLVDGRIAYVVPAIQTWTGPWQNH